MAPGFWSGCRYTDSHGHETTTRTLLLHQFGARLSTQETQARLPNEVEGDRNTGIRLRIDGHLLETLNMDLTTLPTTSRYSGSVPYHEEDDRVTLFLQEGVHDQLSMERAIWWCHQEMDGKPVKIQWRNADKQSIDEQSKTTEGAGQGELPVPGSPDDPLPPDDAGSVPGQVPAV